jgi:CheY-like chemotaxis protein
MSIHFIMADKDVRPRRPGIEEISRHPELEKGIKGMAKILIADDDQETRQMLEETLEELEAYGVELIVAGNGMEALEAIRQHRPELVFLDSLMPKMNGLEVCNTVKKQYRFEGICIIVLTSEGQTYEIGQLNDAGADGSLMKPLDPDEVYETAAKLLGLPA